MKLSAATLEGAMRMVEKGIARSEIFKKWVYVCMYVFAIITAAGPIGYYLLKDLTSDEIAVTSLGFRGGALMAFITQELISQAYAKYHSHIGMAVTIVAF